MIMECSPLLRVAFKLAEITSSNPISEIFRTRMVAASKPRLMTVKEAVMAAICDVSVLEQTSMFSVIAEITDELLEIIGEKPAVNKTEALFEHMFTGMFKSVSTLSVNKEFYLLHILSETNTLRPINKVLTASTCLTATRKFTPVSEIDISSHKKYRGGHIGKFMEVFPNVQLVTLPKSCVPILGKLELEFHKVKFSIA